MANQRKPWELDRAVPTEEKGRELRDSFSGRQFRGPNGVPLRGGKASFINNKEILEKPGTKRDYRENGRTRFRASGKTAAYCRSG